MVGDGESKLGCSEIPRIVKRTREPLPPSPEDTGKGHLELS